MLRIHTLNTGAQVALIESALPRRRLRRIRSPGQPSGANRGSSGLAAGCRIFVTETAPDAPVGTTMACGFPRAFLLRAATIRSHVGRCSHFLIAWGASRSGARPHGCARLCACRGRRRPGRCGRTPGWRAGRRRQPGPRAGRLSCERLCRVPRAPCSGLSSVGRATVDWSSCGRALRAPESRSGRSWPSRSSSRMRSRLPAT